MTLDDFQPYEIPSVGAGLLHHFFIESDGLLRQLSPNQTEISLRSSRQAFRQLACLREFGKNLQTI